MIFNSYPFLLIFLPSVLAGFFLIGAWDSRLAPIWLTLASFAFYAWWDYRFIPLIGASIIWNYAAGRSLLLFARHRSAILFTAIAGDLGLLGYFKYVGFFLGTIDGALGTSFGPFDIVLPLGISFFTFTQIAFIVDAARGEVRDFNFVRYALFVTYFPHLIAGPILHHREIIPQFALPSTYRLQANHVAVGIAFFVVGLAKKCVIADSFSPDAASAFSAAACGGMLSAPIAWKGALAYTLQLYFDFSGYTDMAIGVSRMFNIRLPFNFNSPYKSASIIDFWRRWHMTLARFLRDYIYFPLGGNRRGAARRNVNVLVTMLLCGLWHGAGWTFVIWGGLHGLYLIVNRGWWMIKPSRAIERLPSRLRTAIATAITFFAVLVAWVFFRAADIPSAFRMLAAMTGAYGFTPPAPPAVYGDFDLLMLGLGASGVFIRSASALFYAAALFVVFAMPNTQDLIEPDRLLPGADRLSSTIPIQWSASLSWAIICALLMGTSLMTFSHVSEFIYFQF